MVIARYVNVDGEVRETPASRTWFCRYWAEKAASKLRARGLSARAEPTS